MKSQKVILFSLFLFIFSAISYGQIADDTLSIYENILENDDKLTLDNQKAYIEKAISYSKRNNYVYEELYFREKEIKYFFSLADYSNLPVLSSELLKDVEANFGKGSTKQK